MRGFHNGDVGGSRLLYADLVLAHVSNVCNALETSRDNNTVTQRDTLKANC